MTAATPALMAALKHPDAEMRHWAVRVVGDLISRAGSEAGGPFVDVLAKRLTDENSDARRGAALALLNIGARAAPVKVALKKAAAEDSSSYVRDFAKRALEAIREGKTHPTHKLR